MSNNSNSPFITKAAAYRTVFVMLGLLINLYNITPASAAVICRVRVHPDVCEVLCHNSGGRWVEGCWGTLGMCAAQGSTGSCYICEAPDGSCDYRFLDCRGPTNRCRRTGEDDVQPPVASEGEEQVSSQYFTPN